MNGVRPGNFTPATSNTGGTALTVSATSASGGAPSATWTVTVLTSGTTGQNNGSIGLSLSSIGTIADVATNALAAMHTSDQAYTYDTTQPTVNSINRKSGAANPVNTGPLDFTVTFSEPVNNVFTSNFGLTTANLGGSAPLIASATPNGGPNPPPRGL